MDITLDLVDVIHIRNALRCGMDTAKRMTDLENIYDDENRQSISWEEAHTLEKMLTRTIDAAK